MKLNDLTGKEFGELKVISRADNHITPSGQKLTKWKCECKKCGKIIEVLAHNLTRGHTRSCGCSFTQHNLKHENCVGNTVSRLYNIWAGMKARCYRKSNPRYKQYGKRGISICDEWLIFKNFETWALSNGYNDELTIDRIDNNGNYEPSNCRWVTPKIQSNNSRQNVVITFDNESHTISEWSDITGIPYKALWYRLNSGWSVQKSLTTPVGRVKQK